MNHATKQRARAVSALTADDSQAETALANLEGEFGGLKTVSTVTLTCVGFAITLNIAGFVYLTNQISRVDFRISTISEQVSSLPDKMNENLQRLTSTLSASITASKQAIPQVILMPAPQLPPSPPTTQPPNPPPAASKMGQP